MSTRFDEFTEQETALISFGIAITVGEWLHGILTGSPAPPQTQERDFPVLINLMNECGKRMGLASGIDKDLTAQANAVLSQIAAGARDAQTGI